MEHIALCACFPRIRIKGCWGRRFFRIEVGRKVTIRNYFFARFRSKNHIRLTRKKVKIARLKEWKFEHPWSLSQICFHMISHVFTSKKPQCFNTTNDQSLHDQTKLVQTNLRLQPLPPTFKTLFNSFISSKEWKVIQKGLRDIHHKWNIKSYYHILKLSQTRHSFSVNLVPSDNFPAPEFIPSSERVASKVTHLSWSILRTTGQPPQKKNMSVTGVVIIPWY